MRSSNDELKIGRVTINQKGISQKPLFFIFGESFELIWSEISAWTSSEQVVVSKTTDQEHVSNKVLELQSNFAVNFISRGGGDTSYQAIVEQVRKYIPDKEIEINQGAK